MKIIYLVIFLFLMVGCSNGGADIEDFLGKDEETSSDTGSLVKNITITSIYPDIIHSYG